MITDYGKGDYSSTSLFWHRCYKNTLDV